jgi:hypothetical protein
MEKVRVKKRKKVKMKREKLVEKRGEGGPSWGRPLLSCRG